MRTISIFSWSGNGIINFYTVHKGDFFYKLVTRRYIFQLAKYERRGFRKSINFEDNFYLCLSCEIIIP